MNWRDAYLGQARDDDRIRRLLASDPALPSAHRLHYLQMVTEKLSKGLLTAPETPTATNHPPKVHVRFVRLLQTIKGRPDVREMLGFDDRDRFRAYIDSLLPKAEEVQRLAPSESGVLAPNPEYPWFDRNLADVVAPCDHDFAPFDPTNPLMLKLELLVSTLLLIE